MPITYIGDKIVITGDICPPGMAYVIDRSFVEDVLSFKLKDMDFEPPLPYDRSKVPEGHEPKLMLSDKVDLTWDFRFKTNNWLIDTFGTKQITIRFKSSLMFGLPVKNPASILGNVNA